MGYRPNRLLCSVCSVRQPRSGPICYVCRKAHGIRSGKCGSFVQPRLFPWTSPSSGPATPAPGVPPFKANESVKKSPQVTPSTTPPTQVPKLNNKWLGWAIALAVAAVVVFSLGAHDSPRAASRVIPSYSSGKPIYPTSNTTFGVVAKKDIPAAPYLSPIVPSSSSVTIPPSNPDSSVSTPVVGYDRYYDPTYRPAVGNNYVNGYTRSNGTYVSGHYRTNPDNSFYNNWSTKGNVNPYTGKVGTRQPPSYGGSRRR
jgi:hypothetical protein